MANNKGLALTGAPKDEHWREIVEKLIEELDDDIPDKVVRATELLLSGYPVSKAAKEVGVSTDSVKSWIRKYPTVANVLADGRKYLQLWRMSQLEQQFVKAVGKSEEILNLSFYDSEVNQKLVATVAQHARYIIGLFAGQQIDLNVNNAANDPVMKAKADALDYIAMKMAERKTQTDTPITVTYHVMDDKAASDGMLLDENGEPRYGILGSLSITADGALCHICGTHQRFMSIHITKDHGMQVGDYESTFLLEPGDIARYDNREADLGEAE